MTGQKMATTKIGNGNRLLVTPKEGVEITVLKGDTHFKQKTFPTREMYEKCVVLIYYTLF